ncbi:MAG: glycosyltransferase [Deltaproteobacteria bacterium]|nr:glycosyltransferase [Deltaproteobacteria bacterium]
MSMFVSIVMPVYNEAQYIEEVINRVLKTNIEKELVIVDILKRPFHTAADLMRKGKRLHGKMALPPYFI